LLAQGLELAGAEVLTGGPVLVAGASGLVGRRCLTAFARHAEVVGTYHTRAAPALVPLDLTAADQVGAIIDRVRPAVVICASADPHVEGCEADPARTRRLNVDGTLRLADGARKVGALFVFFSSEYVFDGTAGVYAEDAPLHPLNEYGRQKAECEAALAGMPRSLVVRTSGVFGWHDDGKNFVLQLLARLRQGERFAVPDDQDITPTYAPNLADVLTDLVGDGFTGLIHVAGRRTLNRYEFARAAARVFGLDPTRITPTPTAALPLKARRPRAAGLATDKVRRLVRTPVLDPEEALAAMRAADTTRIS
jgi:dTDP-4-dehydrorhamnose reductase